MEEGKLKSWEVLERYLVRSKYPINESFKDLAKDEASADVVLILNRETFNCHSLVLSANSKYFQ